jgi:hypothetical protein
MRIRGIEEQTGQPCEASVYGIMKVEPCELDGQPAVRCELGNGQTCLARIEAQHSPWLRLYLRHHAGIREDDHAVR